MANPPKPTHADECERVLLVLAQGPANVDAIAIQAKLPNWRVNEIVCDLRLKGHVAHEVARIKGQKVNLYSLKLKVA